MKKYCYDALVTMHEYKRTLTYDNVEALILTVKYPTIELAHAPRSEYLINKRILMDIDEYISYANYLYDQAVDFYHESKINDFPFHAYELYMEYIITYNANCFLSTYNDKYEFTGGAHGNTKRTSDTWELCCGTHLSLNNFFEPGFDYKPMIIEEIIRQAELIYNQDQHIYFDDYKSLITKNFDENSFYLTPQGITIYYQQYDIAPYSTGIVEFTIPYSKIGWYPRC